MSEEKAETTSEDDLELDITSSSFNPLKALYSKNVKLPKTKLDNLSIFISRLKKADNKFEAEVRS